MSIEAVAWALNQAPVEEAGPAAVLLGLANHADPDGANAYPAVERLAYYARMTERSVRRHLRALERQGVIARDEDTRARDAKVRADQRPTVYRLVMTGAKRESYEDRRARERVEQAVRAAPPVALTAADGGSQCPPGHPGRGDTDVATGGHGDPRTIQEPSTTTNGRGNTVLGPAAELGRMVVEELPAALRSGLSAGVVAGECERLHPGWSAAELRTAAHGHGWDGARPGAVIAWLRQLPALPKSPAQAPSSSTRALSLRERCTNPAHLGQPRQGCRGCAADAKGAA